MSDLPLERELDLPTVETGEDFIEFAKRCTRIKDETWNGGNCAARQIFDSIVTRKLVVDLALIAKARSHGGGDREAIARVIDPSAEPTDYDMSPLVGEPMARAYDHRWKVALAKADEIIGLGKEG